MKLRTKMQLLISSAVIVILVCIGMAMYNSSINMSDEMVKDNMISSAGISTKYIASELKNYKKIAEQVGKDEKLSSQIGNEEKGDIIDDYAETFEFTSGNILDINGVSLKDGTDFGDREYVKEALSGNVNVSDITLSKYTNTYGFSIAAPLVDASENVKGVVYFRADIDFMQNIIDSIKVGKKGYAYLIDEEGNVIAHKDQSLIMNLNLSEEKGLSQIYNKMLKTDSGTATYKYKGNIMTCGFSNIDETNGWKIIVTDYETDYRSSANKMINTLLLYDVIAILLVVVISYLIARKICGTVEGVKSSIVSLSEGKFVSELQKTDNNDELGVLQNAAVTLLDDLSSILNEANAILAQMSSYDLTHADMKNYPGDFNSLAGSINFIKSMLNKLILEVQYMAENVGEGTRQIADASNSLAMSTTLQAESIQKVVEDIESVAEHTEKNSNNVFLINESLTELNNQIFTSKQQMTELHDVVDSIEQMSNDIHNIVGTIDSISFQTNILALNASVEAARAGIHGKGFAVVAEEVRNLAAKCGESSKKTESLIDSCLIAIEKALACAENTTDSINNISEHSEQIAEAFNSISIATEEQAKSAAQIKAEIVNVSGAIQNNMATAQETASSTQMLSEDAARLFEMVNKFKVNK